MSHFSRMFSQRAEGNGVFVSSLVTIQIYGGLTLVANTLAGSHKFP